MLAMSMRMRGCHSIDVSERRKDSELYGHAWIVKVAVRFKVSDAVDEQIRESVSCLSHLPVAPRS